MKNKNPNDPLFRWETDVFLNTKQSYQIMNDLKSNLKMSYHPYAGWRPVPNQKLQTISINSNGLRNKRLNFNNDKKKIILLGGSFAWGFGASTNENTPAYLIENYLQNEFKTKVDVINLSDQMYSSFEETNVFINSFDEINPAIVIILSGANDLFRAYRGTSWFTHQYLDLYKSSIISSMSDLRYSINNNLFLEPLRLIKNILFKLPTKANKYNYISENNIFLNKIKKEKIFLNLINKKIDTICQLGKLYKFKVFYFLQPMLQFKKVHSNDEKLVFESAYHKDIKLYNNSNAELNDPLKFNIDKISELNNFVKKKLISYNEILQYKDLNYVYDDKKESIFFDSIHVSDLGNQIIAKEISKILYGSGVL